MVEPFVLSQVLFVFLPPESTKVMKGCAVARMHVRLMETLIT